MTMKVPGRDGQDSQDHNSNNYLALEKSETAQLMFRPGESIA